MSERKKISKEEMVRGSSYYFILFVLLAFLGWNLALAIVIDKDRCGESAVQNTAIATYGVAPFLFVVSAATIIYTCRNGGSLCDDGIVGLMS